MFFSLSVPNCCEIRNLLFCSGNIIKKNSAHVKFSHFFWVRLKKCPVLFVILPATFLRKNFPFCGIYIRFFPSRGRCTIRLECIFRHDIPRYFRYKNFFMQLFHLYWYHFLKKHSRNPFSHFLLRFLLFRIRTPGAFAKLHNGNLQHFPRKCPRRENAKAMKLCVQAIYIYFPFLIPQRYIWVKKKALSGNVIKLSKSAHTKKSPSRLFEVGIFYAFVMWIACAYFAGRTMTCPS